MTDQQGVDLAAQLQQFREETEARFQSLSQVLDELNVLVEGRAAASPATSPAGDAAASLPLLYPSLEAWVVGHFTRIYIRPLGGPFRWCGRWWDHTEAISRLQALWRTWETLRVEPLGMDLWLREQLDHHLPQLLSPAGPFTSCTPERHAPAKDLATIPAPHGWWDPPQPSTSPGAGPGEGHGPAEAPGSSGEPAASAARPADEPQAG